VRVTRRQPFAIRDGRDHSAGPDLIAHGLAIG
jgi:hypothetical protein